MPQLVRPRNRADPLLALDASKGTPLPLTAERPRTHNEEATRRTKQRVETLHDMMTRYHEARSESAGPGGGGSQHGSRINAFDQRTWTREYQELERCLDRLKYLAQHGRPMIERNVSSSAAWWHVRARYLEATISRREIHLRKTHSGERVPARLPRNCEIVARATILHGKSQHMLVRTWDPRVDPRIVGAALRWISREYRGTPAVYSESAA